MAKTENKLSTIVSMIFSISVSLISPLLIAKNKYKIQMFFTASMFILLLHADKLLVQFIKKIVSNNHSHFNRKPMRV